jgi:predicted nucleic acid-binding protein
MVVDGSAQAGTSGVVLEKLAILPTEVEPPLSPSQAKALCEQHGLTVYDAVYLDARHKELSLVPWTPPCSKRHRRKVLR